MLGYVDFRSALLRGDIAHFTCLMGTTVQETYATHPDLRAACDRGMSAHIAMLVRDIEAAKAALRAERGVDRRRVSAISCSPSCRAPSSYAKAKQGPEVAIECLVHLRRYLEELLGKPRNKSRTTKEKTR